MLERRRYRDYRVQIQKSLKKDKGENVYEIHI